MGNNFLKNLIKVLSITLVSLLWRFGGEGYKWCRKYATPILLALVKCLIDNSLWPLLYAPLLFAATALFSYGKESTVNKFWVKILNKDSKIIELLTRATCGFFWSIPAYIFVLSGASLLTLCIYSIFLTLANSYFGTLKNVWASEIGVGASVSCSILI